MSQPPRYTPNHSFVSDSATLPNFPGQQLDVEFQEIKAVTDGIENNLALIQRDDGVLANGSVGYDQLAPSLQTNGLAPANAWASGAAYALSISVMQGGALYRCLIAHTSGVFATDLAAGKWVFVTSVPVPPPSTIALGGVHSIAAAPHQFITSIGTDGTPLQAQPSFSDVSGAASIAQGGTGQGTAAAGFDALAPTTTRGDIIFRAATTNARLPASTAGYHLQTNGPGSDPTWVPPAYISNRLTLKALDTTVTQGAILREAGREGLFVWKAGDYSAQVAADTNEGVYVKANVIAATSGAWVRVVTSHLVPEWFGALKDGVNDDSVAINAALVIASNLLLPQVILSGTYTIANSIVPVSGVVLRGSGAWARINSSTNIAVLLDVSHAPLIHGGIENIKFVNASAANSSAVGLQLDACQRCTFKDLDFFNYDAGIVAAIQPTVVFNSGQAAIFGQDYHNFVFNELSNIMAAKCRIGLLIRGGPTSASVTNVVTLNNYYNVCLRNVTAEGIRSDWYHDNDHFYGFYANLVTNAAVGIHLAPTDPTNYIGVSAHHFYSATITRDSSNPTGLFGIAMSNCPGCIFVGLASDSQWDGTYISNPLNVDVHVLASWMHFNTSDAAGSVLTNRVANVTQNTMTRQSGSASVGAGVTSFAVTFPQRLLLAPAAGVGEIRLTPYSDPGVRYWVDFSTITATGFTMRFSAATPGAFPMLWSAEVFKAS